MLSHRPRINQLKGKKGSCCPSIQKFSLVQGLRGWHAALQETAVHTGGGTAANAQIHECLPVYTSQNTVLLKAKFFSTGLGRWLSGWEMRTSMRPEFESPAPIKSRVRALSVILAL